MKTAIKTLEEKIKDNKIADFSKFYPTGNQEVAHFAEQYCEEKECEWNEDIDYEYFATSCGEAYCLVAGTLEDNKHKYCPFCGGRIVLKEQDKSISIDQYMDLNPQVDPHEQSDEEDN